MPFETHTYKSEVMMVMIILFVKLTGSVAVLYFVRYKVSALCSVLFPNC
jgi:hypothetical protein